MKGTTRIKFWLIAAVRVGTRAVERMSSIQTTVILAHKAKSVKAYWSTMKPWEMISLKMFTFVTMEETGSKLSKRILLKLRKTNRSKRIKSSLRSTESKL